MKWLFMLTALAIAVSLLVAVLLTRCSEDEESAAVAPDTVYVYVQTPADTVIRFVTTIESPETVYVEDMDIERHGPPYSGVTFYEED